MWLLECMALIRQVEHPLGVQVQLDDGFALVHISY